MGVSLIGLAINKYVFNIEYSGAKVQKIIQITAGILLNYWWKGAFLDLLTSVSPSSSITVTVVMMSPSWTSRISCGSVRNCMDGREREDRIVATSQRAPFWNSKSLLTEWEISLREFIVIAVLSIRRAVVEACERRPILFLQGSKHRLVATDEAYAEQ